ncbi:nucleoside hydrolase [Microbacterium sp. zg.Y625]|uniref:nucleoside hydrolase n=1 Tax=Microbacterium jiangjiandongii TaxID=3049071 RepID=UPI00214B418E|nr:MULTISPECIES: nucleoside hydrolase [unclassified Microbacterium]MCR2792752.1 nucleoside hydrolase [Microbacterium sp. zg.Y625]WIM26730.1 nucleoside hydrolase [Microbacterium sp. zg-Y625]
MKRRIIINTDAKNEADDQFAIVHALLSPSLSVEGLIAAHFGDRRSPRSMEESREEIELLLRLLGGENDIPVQNGAPHRLPDPRTAVPSDGARLIIEAAHKPGELSVVVLGPLSDMASAILMDPTLTEQENLTVVWIGGDPYDGDHPGGHFGEFNLLNDVAAANVVFQSGLTVWQIPSSVYSLLGVGYAELDDKVAPHGDLGAYLVGQLKAFNAWVSDRAGLPEMEYRTLGDSPAIGVVINPHSASWRTHSVRTFDDNARMTRIVVPGRTVRVAETYDTRWLLEDMFAKIKAHERTRAERIQDGSR